MAKEDFTKLGFKYGLEKEEEETEIPQTPTVKKEGYVAGLGILEKEKRNK